RRFQDAACLQAGFARSPAVGSDGRGWSSRRTRARRCSNGRRPHEACEGKLRSRPSLGKSRSGSWPVEPPVRGNLGERPACHIAQQISISSENRGKAIRASGNAAFIAATSCASFAQSATSAYSSPATERAAQVIAETVAEVVSQAVSEGLS